MIMLNTSNYIILRQPYLRNSAAGIANNTAIVDTMMTPTAIMILRQKRCNCLYIMTVNIVFCSSYRDYKINDG